MQVQIFMMCHACEISAVYNQQSGKAQISDVSDAMKFYILIEF